MYFFSEEERKYLLKKLIPKAREKGIAEDLRGWNWHSTELSPPHDIILPVWEVSDRYCETGRDSLSEARAKGQRASQRGDGGRSHLPPGHG